VALYNGRVVHFYPIIEFEASATRFAVAFPVLLVLRVQQMSIIGCSCYITGLLASYGSRM
jgi:hypothetical protein